MQVLTILTTHYSHHTETILILYRVARLTQPISSSYYNLLSSPPHLIHSRSPRSPCCAASSSALWRPIRSTLSLPWRWIGILRRLKISLVRRNACSRLPCLSVSPFSALHAPHHTPLHCLPPTYPHLQCLLPSFPTHTAFFALTLPSSHSHCLLRTHTAFFALTLPSSGFVLHLRTILFLYLLSLPMFFATVNGSWTGVPVTCLAAYMLLGLEQLSREVDGPLIDCTTIHSLHTLYRSMAHFGSRFMRCRSMVCAGLSRPTAWRSRWVVSGLQVQPVSVVQ
jgi:hypothetical protein